MNVLPVISRELRAQARQRFTFTLRELGVTALLCAGVVFALRLPFAANFGGALFAYLHTTLFCAIWILVPLSAADCISRERREGTLGLLFLTPLKASDIVIAKSIAHGLRAATLLMAIVPVFTIPFLLGGVSWHQAMISLLVNFSAVCWALAAAIVASSGTRHGLRALVGAVVFSFCGFIAFALVAGMFVSQMFSPARFTRFLSGADFAFLTGMNVTSLLVNRSRPPGVGIVVPGPMLWAMAELTVASLAGLALAVLLAAWQIRRTWREEPPPAWVQAVQRTFCTPVLWLDLFRRWMRWKLERNPLGWLEQRRWTGRLVTWSWFAVIISIYSAYFTDKNFFRGLGGFQQTMAWLLMGSIAASAAGSFRREHETGVLELLLVAPLSTNQIIGGRLRGLWGQFLPAVGILLGIWLYFDAILPSYEAKGPVLYFFITFLALPVIGLYFSVRCRSFISAFLLTLVVGVGLPYVLPPLAFWIVYSWLDPRTAPFRTLVEGSGFLLMLGQVGLALLCLHRLRRRLDQRNFPMEGGVR